METPDAKRLAEVVEANLRDGRTLESLRKAMREAGYEEDSIRDVLSHVDRRNTVRRPQRRKSYDMRWVAASVALLTAIAFGSYIFLNQPSEPNATATEGSIKESPVMREIRTCYVLNESIKGTMIEAGAQCDKWYIIKEV